MREDCQQRPAIAGFISSLIARILRLEEARNGLRERFAHVGAGLGDRPGFFWLEIETAFERRVMTGAVVNSRYVEPSRFLNDAREIVLEKVLKGEFGETRMFEGQYHVSWEIRC